MGGFLRRIPGFRSNTMWKKIVAVVGYLFIFLIIVTVAAGDDIEEADPVDVPITEETEAVEESEPEDPEEEEVVEPDPEPEPEPEEAVEEEPIVEEKPEPESDNTDKNETVSRSIEIENAIRNRIGEGKYIFAELDKITINNDYGSDSPEDYFIALVYFVFDVKNTRGTGNDVMRMYSDDLVATLANQGIEDISEAAIFWEDDYNNRSVKYAYEYSNGRFYISDIAGE